MTMTAKETERNIEMAAYHYKRSDNGRWVAAYFAAQIVGKKPVEFGATIKLADRMGVSVDTVENLAHAYFMYDELRASQYREAVVKIRRMPFIYYSYFRSLYKAKQDYGLTLEQVFGILVDMVHAEGSLHQSDLDEHIRSRFGDTRTWDYYGKKAMKEIHKTLQQPDIPASVKAALLPAYEVLGDQA